MTPSAALALPDADACYRAVSSRDRRFDGVFYTAVRTTGIYCRPSCPARTPHQRNVTFHPTAASAQAAGFRACRRCLPDATPDSPRWDVAADTAGRAMRLIADGVVDRDGVEGLAARLGYSARHLNRLLVAELGAGPLALARARRAHDARVLLETTDWRTADIAFAAGFASVRQFNDTVQEVYAATPTELRGGRSRSGSAPAGPGAVVGVDVRIPVRLPFDADRMAQFLAFHLVPRVEAAGPGWYTRSLRLPHGYGVVRLDLADAAVTGLVRGHLTVSDVRDVGSAVERCRRLLDAGCDPDAVGSALGDDPVLAGSLRSRPGLRTPGHVDGDEIALRTVLGQQVSLKAANRLGGVLAELAGDDLPEALHRDGVTRVFPTPAQVAALPGDAMPMPRSRQATLAVLATALAAGEVALDRSAGRPETRAGLLALKGVGPWTADYVLMRALGDPDVFLPGDVAVRAVLADHGVSGSGALADFADRVSPWRSYAVMHLWAERLDALAAPTSTTPTPREDPR
ncbi:DNA-3-methyladenine glycosylase 2 family protein [Nocardioides sp. HDW12B]|uniref:DNA-3-methyladenine glycosylase 2 family protein n=1 Tax=Nocardioides sp. HDW12B TaxID=2714939 RepID=UPI00140E0508|nr:Ada metal-binding domain-containing protein [Nocardioides sp. HDW12B]QIK67020.1 DNA-3-methyladenine glycosylase 2 family protein [Nocardioides sp. HDW12B]